MIIQSSSDLFCIQHVFIEALLLVLSKNNESQGKVTESAPSSSALLPSPIVLGAPSSLSLLEFMMGGRAEQEGALL